MQDNEFDRLFKDQLGAAEVQPSAGLWAKIETELEPKRRRSLPLYWMAAAVALLVLGLSLLMPEGEKIRLQAPSAALHANKADAIPVVVEQIAEPAGNELGRVKAAQGTPLVIAPRLTAAEIKKSLEPLQPKVVLQHPVTREEPTAVVVKTQVPLQEEVMIASADVANKPMVNEVKEAEQPERRSIRNVGDLVNYVVDRVDKRDQKVLKFNTDEDDNSSLIAINIGFIRLNPKRHK